MNQTSPSSPAADPQFAAFIGLDWADQKHAWALQEAGSQRVEQGTVDNTPEAMDAWVTELTSRFHSQPIAVAVEPVRGSVIAKLSKYANVVLYPIHPKASSDYRSAFRPSGAKSDPSDAVLLLEMVTRHRDRLRKLDPDTEPTRMLRILVERRRDLVDQQTAYTNQLTAVLKQIFPQALDWLDQLNTPLAFDFLERWPTLESLRKVRPQTLRDFFHKHNSRNPERIEQRIQQIPQAVSATEDRAWIEPGILWIRSVSKQLVQVSQAIAEFDAKIEEVAQAHPDFNLVHSFPGAGPVMAPRLLATLGTQRDRFGSADELQCFTGIAPVTVTSGKQKWVHWRWACSKFDRQTIHEWAGHSRKKCEWAREHYQQQRDRGNGHHAAIRSLGYKWLRVLYRCWKDGVPYDEERYLKARRPPPQSQQTQSKQPRTQPSKISTGAVDIDWKYCGGFSKPTRISHLTE